MTWNAIKLSKENKKFYLVSVRTFKNHKTKFQILNAFNFKLFAPKSSKLDFKFNNSKFKSHALRKN